MKNHTVLKSTLFIAMMTSSLYASATHCSYTDEIIFSCKVGKKTVSLCGNNREISYRYGRLGNPELVFSNNYNSGGTLMYAGGGGAYLRLYNGSIYSYVLYTGIGRGWEKAGLSVEKNGRSIRNFTCTSREVSLIGPDLLDRYRVKGDQGFEIP